VRAVIYLFVIMALTLLLVFFGIEALKRLPSLSPEQQRYLRELRYPLFFKIMVAIVWGCVSILSAYLFLLFQYSGFMDRLSRYFDKVAENDTGQKFHFRKNDSPGLIRDSFEALMDRHRKRLAQSAKELEEMKARVLRKYPGRAENGF
jgi:methyl-accepting chemotaxis protein